MSLTKESNRVLEHLATVAPHGEEVVDRGTYRNMLEFTSGWIMAKGYAYNVTGTSAGAGMYRVKLTGIGCARDSRLEGEGEQCRHAKLRDRGRAGFAANRTAPGPSSMLEHG
jgi:hypothetical protein